MKKLLGALLLASITNSFAAELTQEIKINGIDEPVKFTNGYNFDRCLELDMSRKKVIQLDERTCNGLKGHYAKQAAQEEAAKARAEAYRRSQEEYESKRQQELEKKEQEREAQTLAKYQAEKAAEEVARAKQEAEWDRLDREEQKRKDAKIAAIKSRCGNDYKNPQIGMRIERVKDCVAPAKMVSQINRADGVMSIYQYGSQWFNVIEGRVVAWGKY